MSVLDWNLFLIGISGMSYLRRVCTRIFSVRVRTLAMCRGEFSAVIVQLTHTCP